MTNLADELSPREQLALYHEVAGQLKPAQIAAKLGITYQGYYKMQQKPAYQAARRALLDQLQAVRLQQLISAEQILDAHCLEGAGHLVNLMRRADSDGTRLNAVKAVFDYSPTGPKAAKKGEGDVDRRPQINISLSVLKNVSAALGDIGDEETLRLVQGADGSYGVDGEGVEQAAQDVVEV